MTAALLVAGAGGVGKTTLAAALAAAGAAEGLATLALTVDPARRMADALGLDGLGNDPAPVEGAPRLWAAMLDSGAAWEALIRRHADPDRVEPLLQSRFFDAVARRFPAGQAYAAAEQMADHLEAGRWDLVVVDTPPADGGLDFFASPRRVRALVGGRVLRWLTGAGIPGRRVLYRWTARPVFRAADAVLGAPLLEDVADFLVDLRTAYDGIARRSRTVERRFREAAVLVVTTADPAPMAEAVRFLGELPASAAPPAAVVFNRALDLSWADMTVPAAVPEPVAEAALAWGAEARRQADVRAELVSRYGTVPVCVPWVPDLPASVAGLAALAASSGLTPIARWTG